MDLTVAAPPPNTTVTTATWGASHYPCALGRSGITGTKTEGDGATPIGRFVMRRILYRADRLTLPAAALPSATIQIDDGWCDDPSNPHYNLPVRLPFPARHEILWRSDHLYDVVVVLGHNDDPPQPGAGSAIFLHVARPDFTPTEGCVALALPDLLTVLTTATSDSAVTVLAYSVSRFI